MKKFFIEGVFIPAAPRRKTRRGVEAQPFSRVYWAESARQALEQVRADFADVQWLEGPRIQGQSEEQRMRQAGAPELFNFSETQNPKQRRKIR